MSETTKTLPMHIGFILDGNRRWAKANGKPTFEGHRQGLEALKEVSLAAFDKGIEYVSAYAFSEENWQRAQEEVSYLMGLAIKAMTKHLSTFHDAGVRLVMLGSRDRLDKKVLKAIDEAVETTKNNTRGTLALCFNYGGHQEIAAAAQALVDAGEATITPEKLAQNLYVPELPPVDLIIRTSGERRISGFMLWRASYSELYFTDVLWPDFSVKDLNTACEDYANRQRRFGA